MDYAIYKTVDGQDPLVIHQFRQKACRSRAKAAARQKLNDLWLRIIRRPDIYRNARGTKDDISYDFPLTMDRIRQIRFFIAKL